MPELPEVEVVRRGLESHVVGRTIATVEVLHPRPVRRHLAGAEDFAARTTGRLVVGAARRGKYLWLPLDSGDAVLAPPRHERPDARAADGRARRAAPAGAVRARAARGRATRAAVRRPAHVRRPVGLARTVPSCRRRSPTSPATRWTRSSTTTRSSPACGAARRRSSGILLDQTVISGVGNIYADEALWQRGCTASGPARGCARSTYDACWPTCAQVMAAALQDGGTSFDALYVNVNGRERLLRAVVARLRA